MEINNQKNLDRWKFGPQQVVYSAIGASLYMVLQVAASFLHIPALQNVSIRPAAVIPMFFGVAFGPWVGLLSGLAGSLFGDLMSQQGFWPWWCLGNGLMGFLPGLIWRDLRTYRDIRDILKVEGMLVVGAGVGMGLASLSEMWVSQLKFTETVTINFLPMFLSNTVTGLVLVPVLLLVFHQACEK